VYEKLRREWELSHSNDTLEQLNALTLKQLL